ncbi:hypothetical protein VNI00_014904 [Paramarasmius palmivorus]|uniref:F-box domain-containing protein n=1 Tax=Paramarasmius palmivorus TaxID=297713 RepID=A0AAW0BPU9_9AGAR
MQGPDVPLVLGGVCRKWRGVAMATTRLWEHIYINLPGSRWSTEDASEELYEEFRKVMEKKKGRLECWLARSGRVPLTVTFFAGSFPRTEDDWDGFVSLQHDFTRLIVFHATHVRCLTLRAPTYLRDIFGDCGDLRILESFTLLESPEPMSYLEYNGERIYDIDSCLRSPALRSLTLRGDFDLVCLPIPWSVLTEVVASELGGTRGSKALQMLSSGVPCLRSLRITLRDLDSDYERVPQCIFPSLEELFLEIRFVGTAGVKRSLKVLGSSLVTGQLRIFEASCGRTNTKMIEEWPFEFILAPHCLSLQSVCINLAGLTTGAIVDILIHLPSLASLKMGLIPPEIMRETLSALATLHGDSPLCPNLSEIRLDLTHAHEQCISNVCEEALGLAERCAEPMRIRKVWGRSITFPRSRPLADRVRSLREKGLTIDWLYYSKKQEVGGSFEYHDHDTDEEAVAFQSPFRV